MATTYNMTFDGAEYGMMTTEATGQKLVETFLSLMRHREDAGDFEEAEGGMIELIGHEGDVLAHYSVY
jgi:hypothetical protein